MYPHVQKLSILLVYFAILHSFDQVYDSIASDI